MATWGTGEGFMKTWHLSQPLGGGGERTPREQQEERHKGRKAQSTDRRRNGILGC